MKDIDEIVMTLQAQERESLARGPNPYLETALGQIEKNGYFTAGIPEGETLRTPFVLLTHPLPFEGSERMLHNHNCFELVYVYRGICRNLRPGYEVTLKQGDLLLLNPLAIHCLCTHSEEDVAFNFQIPEDTMRHTFRAIQSGNAVSDFFMDYLYHIRTGPDFLIVSREQGDPLDGLIRQTIVEYYEKLPGYNAILQAGLAQMFVYMARRCSHAIQELPMQNTSYLVRNLMLYIIQNSTTVTLADAAKKFSYHEKHISRQMKKELGMIFSQFLRRQRLQNAAQLLAHTDIPVAQIARDVGYHNLSHFYELFQEQYAMTPAAWRMCNHA